MIQPQVNDGGLGFSITSAFKTAINPIAMTKKSYQATKSAAKTGAKVVYKASVLPLQYTLIKPTQWLASKATRPIKNRVRTLVNRRAAKIAMDKRRSTTPTPAEYAEAKAWAKHKLTYDGPGGTPTPHGAILAMFAGPSYSGSLGSSDYYDGQLGVAPAVVAAAVPVLLALANAMISKYAKSGEAPANPRADAQARAEEPPMAAGTQDLQRIQDAAAEAAASAAEDAGADPVEAAASGQVGPRQRGAFGGISRNHMIIGGAVLGGVLLLAMMTKKK